MYLLGVFLKQLVRCRDFAASYLELKKNDKSQMFDLLKLSRQRLCPKKSLVECYSQLVIRSCSTLISVVIVSQYLRGSFLFIWLHAYSPDTNTLPSKS